VTPASSDHHLVARERETAIVIAVPVLSDLLRPWREVSAPKGVPPHVTLLYPWKTPPLSDTDIDLVRAAIANVVPFSIRFGDIARFPEGVLYLKLEDETQVLTLMKAIHSAFPDTPPYGGKFPNPIPHLTLAKVDGENDLDRLHRELSHVLAPFLPLCIDVRFVLVMEEDNTGYWRTKAELPLAFGAS